MKRLLPGLFAFAALSACSVLPPRESPDIYLLPQAAASAQAAAAPQPWQLRVDTPQADRLLDGSRIAVVPQPGRITVYKGARWAAPAPRLLRDRLIDALRAGGRLAGVSSDGEGLYTEYRLDSQLRAFQSEYRDGRPVAVVRLDAILVDVARNRGVATRSFLAEQPADGTAVPQVVAAFGRACDAIAAQVSAWAIDAGERDRQAAAASR
ncbi:putative lipoprotein [Mizugakiibacter sediminis]|uniref:ABC transporter n=1 Tax=Mizugakiibacter sediminis TaxID=1475481 RepID=A0A0K8QLU6_9GAMM|nr:ABC-type transport auxiliary lipoprotein family protein [Mizugakiibacter sediminis]GAP65656.1 putative lipoprotein [Mizugakiibacter sediminis]